MSTPIAQQRRIHPGRPSPMTTCTLMSCIIVSALMHSGCTVDPEKQANIDAMVAEQNTEQDHALNLLENARAEPSLATYGPLVPLMQRSDLLITFDDFQMNVDSAARKVFMEHPDIFHEALVNALDQLTSQLPNDDTPLPMSQAQELLLYVKLLVDTASEIQLVGGAATVPSVNVFIKAIGDNGPTQLTVGYLYPYGDVGPASQVVITSETLPPLVAHLSAQIEQGLATNTAAPQ